MARWIFHTVLLVLAVSAVTAKRQRHKRGLMNLLVDPFQKAWGTVAPEKSKQACRALGWVDKDPNYKASLGLLDIFVPDLIADAFGLAHGAVATDDMQERFCRKNDMIRASERYAPTDAPPTAPPFGGQGVTLPPVQTTIYCGPGYPTNPKCPPPFNG